MKLLTLKLHNFRQFYGTSPNISFAHGERNITVFHGDNGAGKTALLNAFTWLLFDSTSPGFQFPDQIVNLRAIREAKEGDSVDAWVELTFEHQNNKYSIQRVTQIRRTSSDPGWVSLGSRPTTMQYCGPDGEWKTETRVADVIGRILPPDLHSYFFFDGERIEKIVKPQERKEIATATKKLLGVEILDRAEIHLKAVRRELEKELQDIGDAATRNLITEKQRLEEDVTKLNNSQEEIERNINNAEERQKDIEGRLRDLEETRTLQLRRDQLTTDRAARVDSLKQARFTLSNTVSSNGYTIFLSEPIDKFRSLINSLQQRGELPAGIKRNFVSSLLEDRKCICGSPLAAGTKERLAVESWVLRAGLADVEEKALKMGGEITILSQMTPDFLRQIDDAQGSIASISQELSRIENELDDIRRQVEGNPREDITALERKRDELIQQIHDYLRDHGANNKQILDMGKKIGDIEESIKVHKVNEERQALAQRRVSAADEAMQRIAQIRALLEADFREGLLERITHLFREISPTPYVPDLTEDYSLRLLNAAGGLPIPVAASQGENQILSLAFIGSIIQLAREFHAKQEHLPSPESSTYPVVMDSPFGSLGSIYRHQIAEHIPQLADQVITMVTKTQWRGEVEQSMARRTGRSYVLTYYSPRDDLKTDSIDISGKSYDLVKRSPNVHEFTEIVEVSHG